MDGMSGVAVAKVILDQPEIVAPIRQSETTGASQHVRTDWRQAGARRSGRDPLAGYLHSVEPRREIQEELNVIEQWNGANDFVFFVRRGELASNRHEDHEVSVRSLHLLQNCMIYVNTLMLQMVLSRPHWAQNLCARDPSALTPLIWEHVTPYGRFELDMNNRLPLD
jgi:hypothetical protein